MERDPGKRRRKRRPASACPNHLFVKWIEEWRDEARKEESKVQYAYTMALNSLKKYPLPLTSGQEAKILDHIGEKLAKKLDKKLTQYRANGGDTDGSVCVTTKKKRPKLASQGVETGSLDEEDCGAGSSAKTGKRKRSQVEYVPEYRSGPYAILIALLMAQQKPNWMGHLTKAQLMTQAQPHSDKSFTIPDDGKYYTAWSSMATLIRKGLVDKRSCPAKFRLTEAGEDMAGKLLQASSSLASSPTASSAPPSSVGDSSTSRVRAARKSSRVASGSTSASSSKATSRGRAPVHPPVRWSQSPDDHSDDKYSNAADCGLSSRSSPPCAHPRTLTTIHTSNTSQASPSSSLPEMRVANTGASVSITLSDSDGSSDVEILPLFSRIKGTTQYSRSHRDSSPAAVRDSELWCVAETPMCTSKSGCMGSDNKRGERERVGGELLTPQARKMKTGTLTPAQMAGQAALCRLEKSGGEAQVTSRHCVVDLRREKKIKRKICPGTKSSLHMKLHDSHEEEEFPAFFLSSELSPSQHHQAAPSPPARSSLSPPSRVHSSVSSAPVHSQPHCSMTCTAGVSNDYSHSKPSSSKGTQLNMQGTSVDLGKPLFVLKPGEFDVILCVDSAESTASRKCNSQFRGILLQELGKNGVKFDVRQLNVGDFLWIAREKTAPLPGQLTLPQSKEAVLEYIVERKRMDDLAGSITDGRFREQKFRLKHCGVKYPMYLVEEFKDALHLKLPLRNLEQAISNVQVIDGFPVHRTTDIRDSVAYLTLMTRQLHHHYADKTVKAFMWDTIAQLNRPNEKLRLESRDATKKTTLAMEFSSFNESSVKNKTLTVYEMFGRHLMQVPGLSAERAAAILDHYPTITALRDAYKKCSNDQEREALITKLKAGQNRRLEKRIGKIMCGLYWRQ